jgi:hypothetical protein
MNGLAIMVFTPTYVGDYYSNVTDIGQGGFT